MAFDLSLTLAQTQRPRAIRRVAGEDLNIFPAATFTLRWYAFTLDLVFLLPLLVAMRRFLARPLEHLAALGHPVQASVLGCLALAMPAILYFSVWTWWNGRTLGKRVVGLRVIGIGRECRLPWYRVLLRETVGKLVSALLVGFAPAQMRQNPQLRMLHDYLGKSRVISYLQQPLE